MLRIVTDTISRMLKSAQNFAAGKLAQSHLWAGS
jgi:hypothetical protein